MPGDHSGTGDVGPSGEGLGAAGPEVCGGAVIATAGETKSVRNDPLAASRRSGPALRDEPLSCCQVRLSRFQKGDDKVPRSRNPIGDILQRVSQGETSMI